jgi:hypothetical protein
MQRSVKQLALAAAVASALGFGAVQVLAAPSAVPTSNAPTCDPDECEAWCGSMGGVGQCVGFVCRCIL